MTKRSRLVALKQYAVVHWFKSVLVVACLLFSWNSLKEWTSVRELEFHVAEMATQGGGVLFLMSLRDCTVAGDLVGLVAARLEAEGIAVKGLVVRDSGDETAVETTLAVLNDRFAHTLIDAHTARALVGAVGTPVALGIASDGSASIAERLGAPVSDVSRLAERLVLALGDSP